MKKDILETIGNTPLVRLTRAIEDAPFNLFAKLEAFNPGGSIKDRAALSMMKHALDNGLIERGTTVIESSSGNMGIGLAQACAYLGLHFICVIDPKTTRLNIEILQAYGAEIDLIIEPDKVTGEFLHARLNRVKVLLEEIPGSFCPDQYSNEYNAKAHELTMHEIVTELDRKVDYLFCATSTCGTLRGCSDYLRKQYLKTTVIAVDAVGSVIFKNESAMRLIPGHGAAVSPPLFRPGLAHACVHVSDGECVVGCRRLVTREAILAGGSSGAILMAIEKMKRDIPRDANCVAILADRGERYLDTIYSDEWVRKHFGDISHLWQQAEEFQTTAGGTDRTQGQPLTLIQLK